MARSGFAAGFAGFLIGVVTGLGIAAGAMLVISKSPMPFVDKVDRVTADVDPAAKLAGGVDPNARLNQQNGSDDAAEAGSVRTVKVPAAGADAGTAAPAPAAVFWVQVGSYSKKADADNAVAALAMQAIGAQVQTAGSSLWRVRVGPFENRQGAEEALNSLTDQGMKALIVRDK